MVTMSPETADQSKTGKTATLTFESQVDGSLWTVTIMAVEALYAGMFAGELKADANGEWKFERALYVQNTDESTGTTWGTASLQGGNNDTDGKTNTYNLYINSYINPAINLCFQKNPNYASITGVSDTGYNWYLPAQKQLMAIWIAHASFDSQYQFYAGNYWTSTERGTGYNTHSWNMDFTNGGLYPEGGKAFSYRIRCVRDL